MSEYRKLEYRKHLNAGQICVQLLTGLKDHSHSKTELIFRPQYIEKQDGCPVLFGFQMVKNLTKLARFI
jgi:hypothetical protein